MKQILLYLLSMASAASAATPSAHFHTIGRGYATHIVHPIVMPRDTFACDTISSIMEGDSSKQNVCVPHVTDISEKCLENMCPPLRHIYVTSPYGLRRDPFTGRRRKHLGLDLRARNEEVFAMLDGRVIKTGENKRAGKYITLQHGDYTISYCHLSRIIAPVGTIVRAGDAVAISGNTGRSTSHHLHITMKCGTNYLNPAVLLAYIADTSNTLAMK